MSVWTIGGFVAGGAVCFLLGHVLGSRKRSKQKSTRDPESIAFKTLVGVTLAVAIAVTTTIIWFLTVDWPTDAAKTAEFGQRGDFFGGFVNPFLTFIAFIGFLYTVMLQRQEIKDGREQAVKASALADEQNVSVREQNYQAAFFQMLGAHNDIVNSIRVEDPARDNSIVTGRGAFRTIYSAMRRVYRDKKKQYKNTNDSRVLAHSYETVYRKYQYELGHYFRSLYNTIILLEDGPSSEKYIKLLRAQLSNQELLILFYNCAISPHGERFKALAERHEIFNNLPPYLLETSHAKLLPDAVFGTGGYAAILAGRAQILGDMRDAPKPA